MDEIQLNGDPRLIAKAIYRAALEAFKQKHGEPLEAKDALHEQLKKEVPEMAKQMVQTMTDDVRDVYLMNAFEVMALNYARRDF